MFSAYHSPHPDPAPSFRLAQEKVSICSHNGYSLLTVLLIDRISYRINVFIHALLS